MYVTFIDCTGYYEFLLSIGMFCWAGMHKVSKNLGATLKLYVPEAQHKEVQILGSTNVKHCHTKFSCLGNLRL